MSLSECRVYKKTPNISLDNNILCHESPISRFVTKLIPNCIQASTSVGIGLITALAGATEIGLVVRGRYTIVDMGEITNEVVIAISALIIVAACLHYHVKGAFCLGLIFGTVVWWMVEPHDAPKKVVFMPEGETGTYDNKSDVALLVFNLLFLYILVLNGLSRAMSDLAGLTKKSGAIPRAGESVSRVCLLCCVVLFLGRNSAVRSQSDPSSLFSLV